MTRRSLASAVLVALLATAACTSSSPSGGGSDGGADSGSSDGAATDSGVSPNNCVKPGYAGNEKGVGAYCDANTSCPFNGTFLVCTFGHGAPSDSIFCTTPCVADKDCGSGAYCVSDPSGRGCVPSQCGGAPSVGDAAPE